MAKVEVDIHDNSYDNSGDGELLGMVDEGSFVSTEGKSHIITQSYLDNNEEHSTSYHFKEIPGSVTYKIVQMPAGGDTTNNVSTPTRILPSNEYYVIGNPVEVFGNTAQKKLIPKDTMQNKIVTAKKRDDKRRATHNEVERRRRDKINSWITKLAALVPNSGPDSASKGGILAKACDYISDLTERQKKFEKLEVDNEKLILEILRLNQEIADLRKENTSMRNQLADNCIMVHRPKTERS